MKKILLTILGIAIAGTALALNVTVPAAPGPGYYLVSTGTAPSGYAITIPSFITSTTGNWLGTLQGKNPSDFLSSSTIYVSTTTGNWIGTFQNKNASDFLSSSTAYVATTTGNWLGKWQALNPSDFLSSSTIYITTTTGNWIGTWQAENPSDFLASSTSFTTSSLTAGYIPYATSSNKLLNSNIFQSGSNIGIATTTPATALVVYAASNPLLSIISGNGGGSNGLILNRSDAPTDSFGITIPSGVGPATNFTMNNVNIMTLLGTGNVGIGTTAPQQKLTLSSGNNLGIEMATPSAPTMTASSTGVGTFASSTYYVIITASDGTGTTTQSGATSIVLNTASSSDVSWSAVTGAAQYQVYINTTTTSWTNTLATTTTGLSVHLTTSTVSAISPPSVTTAYVNKITASGNSWFNGGNVGIGTIAPTKLLTVNGGVRINSSDIKISAGGISASNVFSMTYNDTTGNMNMTTSGGTQNHITFNPVGNVGVGTTVPAAKLDVQKSSTDPANNDKGTNSAYTVTLTTTTANSFYNGFYSMAINGTSTQTGSDYGFESDVTSNSTTTLSQLVGFKTAPRVGNSGTVTNMYGAQFTPGLNAATGNIGQMYGFYYGPQINASSTGVITNNYGAYLQSPVQNGRSGSITNNFGLYLENQVAGSSTNYSIYSAGGNNYFAGNIGIGTTTPATTLQIDNISSTLKIGGQDNKNSCLEMQDESTSSYKITYNYISSTAWVSTTTKPSFCQ